MTDPKVIFNYIKNVKKKRLLLHAFYAFLTSSLILLAVIVLNVLLRKVTLIYLPHNIEVYLLIHLSTFTLFFLFGYRDIASLIKNAIYIDERFLLKDRFSSYVDCTDKAVTEDILRFQEHALTKEILPGLRGKRVVDIKSHYSIKYLLLLAALLFLLPHIKDKTGAILALTQDEMQMLIEQEDEIKEFVAYLKNKDIKEILSEEKIREFSKLYQDAIKEIEDIENDRKKAIKLLSKLIDNSQELMKENKYDLDSAKETTEFDTDKLDIDEGTKEDIASKLDDLKEHTKKIEDTKESLDERQENTDEANELVKEIEEQLKGGKMPDMPGKKSAAVKSDKELSEDIATFKKGLDMAKSELEKIDKNLDLESELQELSEKLKSMKDSFSELKKGEGDENGYAEKREDVFVTFDSKIKEMKRGQSGTGGGPGTTNEDVGYSSFRPAPPKEEKMIYDMTKSEYEMIYAPSRIDTKKEMLVLKGKVGEGESVTLFSARELPTKTAVNVPYSEVYGDYKEVAQKAVNSQKVPKVYKEYVLDYFDSINPDLR